MKVKSALLLIDKEVAARGLSVTATPRRLPLDFQCHLVKRRKVEVFERGNCWEIKIQ